MKQLFMHYKLFVKTLKKMASSTSSKRKFIDIGANLTDPMFRGLYHGSQKHPDDLKRVLQRGYDIGVEKIIVTGGSLTDSKLSMDLTKQDDRLFSTVGCHPTRCGEFETKTTPEQYLNELKQLARQERVVAVGECGLDYDRLEFCVKETQKKYFELQIDLAEDTGLPMFLHCRNAATDLVEILSRNRERFTTGVVHSFDGSREEAMSILDLNLYIGINGCSLKTKENLEVVKCIPQDKLMVETDSPWCEVKPTHAGFCHVQTKFPSKKKEKWDEMSQVKGRNEPANIVHVLEVLAGVREEDPDQLAASCFNNTSRVFFSANK